MAPNTRRSSLGIDTFEQATAEFDLTGVPEATYDLRVTLADGNDGLLSDAVEVVPGGTAKLETELTLPGGVLFNNWATFYVEYANTGAAAMPAPILTVQSADPEGDEASKLSLSQPTPSALWTFAHPDGFHDSVQILASGEFPGLLLPGERVRVPVYYAGLADTWDTSDRQLEMELLIREAGDTELIDWPAFKDELQPASINDDAWDVIFPNLVDAIGPTWGDYIATMSENANYLHRLGLKITDVSELFGFEVEQAIGLPVVTRLTSGIDARVSGAGLPLEFGRSFGNTIPERVTFGPLGYGWTVPWHEQLEVLADGTVVIRDAGEVTRRFQPDTRRQGTFFDENGDRGTLVELLDGTYELTEFNGDVRRFTATGQLASREDFNGNQVTAGYTGNQLTSLTHSGGESLTFTYNAAGLIESVTESDGDTTIYQYDAANEYLIAVTDSDGTTRYGYSTDNDPARRHALTSASPPAGPALQWEYDSSGRLSASQLEGGIERVTFSYTIGEVHRTDGAGATTSDFFDHRNATVRGEDGAGGYILFEYDDELNLVRRTDAMGRAVTYAWSAASAVDEVLRTRWAARPALFPMVRATSPRGLSMQLSTPSTMPMTAPAIRFRRHTLTEPSNVRNTTPREI